MRKIFSLVLALIMVITLFGVMPSYAAFTEVRTETATDIGPSARLRDGGYYFHAPYSYIGFKSIDLTGAKSIVIRAYNDLSGTNDGEWLQVRLDNPKGELLGYVNIDKDSEGVTKEYRGAIKETSGVHDLYFMSTIAAKGGHYRLRIDSFTL